MSNTHTHKTIINAAQHACATIVLPESDDVRVLTAAANAQNDGIANCILLGDKKQICQQAADANINIPNSLQIISAPKQISLPQTIIDIADAMINKQQTTAAIATAAMMVRASMADGMLAGATATTATVMRPILKIIGKRENSALASSFFLMSLPTGTALFADCALNIRPDAEQLAEIAVQSVSSAAAFGINPVVAMLSYATDNSASGEEVTRIANATKIAKQQMPNTPVFGPIQYDAAVSSEIAVRKCPQWAEQLAKAGQTSVFIFPDLAAGNITYKAVQQLAKIAAIGPLMQGINAPANDLSRGATAEDIYYTIAATSAQSLARG